MSIPTSAETAAQTFRLMYRSHDRIPISDRRAELGKLFSAARSANKARQVTGALLVTDDGFVQVLEGEESTVRALFDHIEKDPRHDAVAVLDARSVDGRVFARWAMAKVARDDEPDIPLIAHADGIAAAASRGTTPEQEQVLDVMREAARSGSHATRA